MSDIQIIDEEPKKKSTKTQESEVIEVKGGLPEEEISNPGDPPKTPKKHFISIDNTPEDVLHLNQAGADLYFEDSPGTFLPLEDNVIGQLSDINRLRYNTAKQIAQGTLNFARPQYPHARNQNPGYASATAQLRVENRKPGMAYSWQLGTTVPGFEQMGMKVCTDPDVRTFRTPVGGARVIKESDGTELVLMECPQALIDQKEKFERDTALRRSDGLEEAAMGEMVKSGGLPVSPQKTRNLIARGYGRDLDYSSQGE